MSTKQWTSVFGVLGGGLGARAHVKFLIDATAVGMHGGKSNAELVGDFLEEIALRNQFENLALALGQGLHLPAGSSAFLKGLDNLPGDVAAHGRAAPVDLLERATQLGKRRLLE